LGPTRTPTIEYPIGRGGLVPARLPPVRLPFVDEVLPTTQPTGLSDGRSPPRRRAIRNGQTPISQPGRLMAIASSKAMIVSTSMSPSNNHTRSLSGLSQTVPCAAWLVTAATPTATTRTENASAREPARSACPAHQCCNHRDEVHKRAQACSRRAPEGSTQDRLHRGPGSVSMRETCRSPSYTVRRSTERGRGSGSRRRLRLALPSRSRS